MSKCDDLKPYVCGGWCCEKEAYPKDKVDEAIAEIKAENVRLKAENKGLKDENARLMSRPCYVCKEEQVKALEKKFQELEGGTLILYNENNLRHHKYKRCFMMAQEWRNYAAFCGMQSSCHNHRGFGKTAEKWTWKEIHAWKCVKRLKKIAEKFK